MPNSSLLDTSGTSEIPGLLGNTVCTSHHGRSHRSARIFLIYKRQSEHVSGDCMCKNCNENTLVDSSARVFHWPQAASACMGTETPGTDRDGRTDRFGAAYTALCRRVTRRVWLHSLFVIAPVDVIWSYFLAVAYLRGPLGDGPTKIFWRLNVVSKGA